MILLSSVLCVLRAGRSSSLPRVFLCLPIFIITLRRSCSLYHSPFLYNTCSSYLPHLSRYLLSHHVLITLLLSQTHTYIHKYISFRYHPSSFALYLNPIPCRPCSPLSLKETTTRLLNSVSLPSYLLFIYIILIIPTFLFSPFFYFSL